ncbi:MAG: hypothetical protein WCS43_07740 [Verrucomicrobiota bacterium]
MKKRLWVKIVAWSVLTFLFAVLVYHFAEKLGSEKHGNYALRRVAKKLHISLQPVSLTDSERAKAKATAASWKRKFLIEFPALNITEHPVPYEENGFRMLYDLGNSGLPISEEFAKILGDLSDCDLEVAKRCLAAHSEVVEKVEYIGNLQTRSSSGMPEGYVGFISARAVKQCAEIGFLKARLAVVAGDEEEALRCFSVSINIADHFQKVEVPSLIGATVCILIDLSGQNVVYKSLLPALGKSANLTRWKALLCRRDYSTTEFARFLRGEWQIGADFMGFPLLAQMEKQGEIPDAEAVLRFHSSWTNDVITKLPSLGLADFDTAFPPPGTTSKLSEEGRSILQDLSIGLDSWRKGYARSAVVNAQGRAAMDLLILEKSGVKIVADDVGRITRDPVSGKPFVFDPIKRELTAPCSSASMDVLPLSLPW